MLSRGTARTRCSRGRLSTLTAWQSWSVPEGEAQDQGVMSSYPDLRPGKTPPCWRVLCKGRGKAPSLPAKEEKLRTGCAQAPPPCTELLDGGGCLVTTSKGGRTRLSCFGSAPKLQSSGGNRTQGDAQGEKDVLLRRLLFWTLFISDTSQLGRQSREAI